MANNLNTLSNDELEKLAAQNSEAWHGSDAKTQQALHEENIRINAILDARKGTESAFDSGTGRWSVTAGAAPSADALAGSLANLSAARPAGDGGSGARAAAVQRAVDELEDSRRSTQEQYSRLFRQLYLDKMRANKNLSQQLAANGVTGGAAETTRLGYDTAYEDALRQGEENRIRAVGAIDRAITDTRLTGGLEIAKAAEEEARQQTDAYADTLRYLLERQDKLDAQREKYEREDAALARKEAEQQREAEEKAEKPALTAAQVVAALKAGVRTEAVLAAYEYYYGKPYN